MPLPVENLSECLGDLEKFLHYIPQPTSALLKVPLAHVQFETIHPFLDGNGRLGRLLITLILCEQKALKEPLLYLSPYFKEHRQYYHELLNDVRINGDWEAWLKFLAEVVSATATSGVASIKTLALMAENDRQAISTMGRAADSALKIHFTMLERPIARLNRLTEKTGLTSATINKALTHLDKLGIIKQLGENRRNRLFTYSRYLEI